jgi:hypothetical protein
MVKSEPAQRERHGQRLAAPTALAAPDRISASEPVQARATTGRSTAGLLQLQRAVGNRATIGVIRRWGALGVGVPGVHVVPANTVLTHGTDVGQFQVRAGPNLGQDQDTPDAPAWLAIGSRFSAHAGSRGGANITHLHNYLVQNNLNLVAFDDFDDLDQYLTANGHPGADENGVAEAGHVLALNGAMDGYYLTRDLVRNEPEIILFAAGLAKLQFQFRSELESRIKDQEDFHDDRAFDRSRTRELVGGGQVIHQADTEDLANFRTVGDRGGRARSQSFTGS